MVILFYALFNPSGQLIVRSVMVRWRARGVLRDVSTRVILRQITQQTHSPIGITLWKQTLTILCGEIVDGPTPKDRRIHFGWPVLLNLFVYTVEFSRALGFGWGHWPLGNDAHLHNCVKRWRALCFPHKVDHLSVSLLILSYYRRNGITDVLTARIHTVDAHTHTHTPAQTRLHTRLNVRTNPFQLLSPPPFSPHTQLSASLGG